MIADIELLGRTLKNVAKHIEKDPHPSARFQRKQAGTDQQQIQARRSAAAK
jgi:hypothetical protein